MATESHPYTAFGLTWSLPFACHELVAGAATAEPDVQVTWGDVPEALDGAVARGAWYQAAPGAMLIAIAGVARYWICQGRSVVIDRAPGAPVTDIGFYLLGVCAGAVLNQRGTLALHGSAIATPGGAAVFIGRKGAGKSTLLGELLARGHRMLADDIVALTADSGGRPHVQPGFPLVKLWGDSARALAFDPARLRPLARALDKAGASAAEAFCREAQPLRAVYALDPDGGAGVRPLSAVDAFQAVVSNLYGASYLHRLGMGAERFAFAADLVRGAPFRLAPRLAWAGEVGPGVRALADAIERDLDTV